MNMIIMINLFVLKWSSAKKKFNKSCYNIHAKVRLSRVVQFKFTYYYITALCLNQINYTKESQHGLDLDL